MVDNKKIKIPTTSLPYEEYKATINKVKDGIYHIDLKYKTGLKGLEEYKKLDKILMGIDVIINQIKSNPQNDDYYFDLTKFSSISLRPAIKMVNKEKLKEIETIFLEGEKLLPESKIIHNYLGNYYLYTSKELYKAIEHYKTLARMDYQNNDNYFYLTRAHNEKFEYKKAWIFAERFLKNNIKGYLNEPYFKELENKVKGIDNIPKLFKNRRLDRFFFKARNKRSNEERIRLFKKIIKSEPDNIYPYLNLKNIYKFRFKDPEKALKYMEMMFKNATNINPIYYLEIAFLYAKTGDEETSKEYYQKGLDKLLLKISTSSTFALEDYYYAGFAFYMLDDTEKCLQYYQKLYDSIKNETDIKIVTYLQSKIFLLHRKHSIKKRTGVFHQIKHFNELFESNNNEYLEGLIGVDIVMRMGIEKHVFIVYDSKWHQYFPPFVYEMFLNTFLNAIEHDINSFRDENCREYLLKAMELIKKQMIDNPKNCKYYIDLSNIFLKASKLKGLKKDTIDKIEDILYKGLNKFPDNYEIVKALADFHFNKKDYERAIKYYSKTLEVSHNPEIYEMLAQTYLKIGDYKKSLKYAEKYLEATDDQVFKEILLPLIHAKINRSS